MRKRGYKRERSWQYEDGGRVQFDRGSFEIVKVEKSKEVVDKMKKKEYEQGAREGDYDRSAEKITHLYEKGEGWDQNSSWAAWMDGGVC
jgi:hypothetical protein